MNFEGLGVIIIVVLASIAGFYVLYIVVATSLYLARASGRNGRVVQLGSRIFPGISRRIDAMRRDVSAEQLGQTDHYLRRGLARLSGVVVRIVLVLGALGALIVLVTLLL